VSLANSVCTGSSDVVILFSSKLSVSLLRQIAAVVRGAAASVSCSRGHTIELLFSFHLSKYFDSTKPSYAGNSEHSLATNNCDSNFKTNTF